MQSDSGAFATSVADPVLRGCQKWLTFYGPAWRIALRRRAAARAAGTTSELERTRGVRDRTRDVPAGWGRARAQLEAAKVGAAMVRAAEAANVTKASW